MLRLSQITKTYRTGEVVSRALDKVSFCLRDNEFVAILGPSGSGKTTLLNIIGGLDRYEDGEMWIDGISTGKYNDRDWDSYRNHRIGFVFQSYNLIPHQNVLSNVELALTISGVPAAQRKARALKALEEVGLRDQVHKRPNQLSGGQMQRVAIARALVNDPAVLLADEPTGALDSETSLQVMELLKKVAAHRLVVMVTHNEELARQYATRIVQLKDGRIVGDSNPCEMRAEPEEGKDRRKKSGMDFLTSLSLSTGNLRTKKGRTLLTAIAGSIGIIGIALIQALSGGVNRYIADIQRDTMSSYPITISESTLNVSGMMSNMRSRRDSLLFGGEEKEREEGRAYADTSAFEAHEMMEMGLAENDLTAFKQYLDNPDSEIQPYLGENGIVYTYDVRFEVYTRDENGAVINTGEDVESREEGNSLPGSVRMSRRGGLAQMSFIVGGSSGAGAENFSEMLAGKGEEMVSRVVTDSYDLLAGSWPRDASEVVLVLDEEHALPAEQLCQLGYLTAEQYRQMEEKKKAGEKPEQSWSYEELCGKTFWVLPACDRYDKQADGSFSYVEQIGEEQLAEKGILLTVSGVICPAEGAAGTELETPVAYTAGLTRLIIEHTAESAVVLAQQAAPEMNVLTGLPFQADGKEAELKAIKSYLGKTSGGTMGMMAGFLDEETLLSLYDEYLGESSCEENLKLFGVVRYDAPQSINIYTDSFEAKDQVAACIERYNQKADPDKRITYTDFVQLMTSSLTSIVNSISYVLIAFVAISLIVSCIMIGIITHISVMERTKEIGVLRALGASKSNISQVFIAETIMVGLIAGLLGIGMTQLLIIPVNAVIHALAGDGMSAFLAPQDALLLIALSILITVFGGLLPARKAAKKDPVAALRTE